MKRQYIIELQRGVKWKKSWWTVPPLTYPFPVRIPSVSFSNARQCLRRAKKAFPHVKYRIAEVNQ